MNATLELPPKSNKNLNFNSLADVPLNSKLAELLREEARLHLLATEIVKYDPDYAVQLINEGKGRITTKHKR